MNVLQFKPLSEQPQERQDRVWQRINKRRSQTAMDQMMAAYLDWWRIWFS